MAKHLRYHINYGFLGGPATGRKMRQLLTAQGFKQASEVTTADIVIAHSAGCWELGRASQAKLIMLVGFPLAIPSARTSAKTNRARVRVALAERQYRHGLSSFIVNAFYGLSQPARNLSIIRNAKEHQKKLSLPKAARYVFIANRHDPWVQAPGLSKQISENPTWSFISLSGSHDDIWAHPERYAAIINHYASLLA